MKKKNFLYTLLITLLFSQNIFAQYGIPTPEPMLGLDTLYFRSDSMNLSLDPDARNNPFMQSSSTGAMSSADDPGGPGSGGGSGAPPPDVIVPLDGGVGFLVVAGALLGLKRRKRKVVSVKDAK